MGPGQEGGTVFPKDSSGDKIVDAIADITTSPSTKWYAQTGTGLLSDDYSLVKWFSEENDSAFNLGRAESPKHIEFVACQVILAIRGEWDKLKERCGIFLSSPSVSLRKYVPDLEFYSALASGKTDKMSKAIEVIVSPKFLSSHLTWGAGSSLVGVAANSAGGIAANSVVAAVAANTATSTINNRGDLGAVAKDVTSSDSLKGYAIAGVSGGIGNANIGLQLAVNSSLKTILQGGKFKDNLTEAAVMMSANILSGYIYQNVGNALNGSGLATKVAVHAIVGGLIGEAAGGDFRTAALAAGANEALLETFGSKIFPGDAHERLLAMTSQLVGMTVAAAAGGTAKDQEKAGWVTQQATAYNYLQHEEVDALAKELVGCPCQGAGWMPCKS
ncbi:hypothetical protein DNF23_39980 [Pseudomonas syringae pv. pisi]|nr:hypothetical protein AL064_07125 [Pseudomonas syringae pv. syringae]